MSEKRHAASGEEHWIPRHPQHPNETPPMIINDIAHLFRGKMRSCESEGIMSQHGARMIISALAHHDGLRQIDLVRMTHMKAPTVSVLIKKMAAEGLLTHEVLLSDLRAVRLHLTEKGREMEESSHRSLCATDEIMMQGFSEEECEQLKILLNRVRENLVRDLESHGLLRPAPTLSETEEEAGEPK